VLVAAAAPPVRAQRSPEWRLEAVGTAVRGAVRFLGAGLGLDVRTTPRVSLGVLLAGGRSGSGLAARGEALAAFSLAPVSGQGLEPYLAGGLAAMASGSGAQGYATALVGVTFASQRRASGFVEAGVGGGLRLGAGIRWRGGSQ
jgi:hypothetical protein